MIAEPVDYVQAEWPFSPVVLTEIEKQQQWCLGRRYARGDEFVWRVGEFFFEDVRRAVEFFESVGTKLEINGKVIAEK